MKNNKILSITLPKSKVTKKSTPKKRVSGVKTGIGRAQGLYAIRTKKYGSRYIGLLYMDKKLIYSKGNFLTEKDAQKSMSDAKSLMNSFYSNLSVKEKKRFATVANSKEAKSPGTKKSELFLK